MPIDSNIALSFKPVQLQNPLEQYGQIAQIQQAQNQNRLADLMYGEKQREITDTNALNQLYKTAIGADGQLDRAKLMTGAAQGGLGSKVPALQKTFADMDKSVAEAHKIKLENAHKQLDIIGQVAGSVRDQESYDRGLAILKAQGIPLDNVPAVYDPVKVKQTMMMAISAKDQIEQALKDKKFALDNANEAFSLGTDGKPVANEQYQQYQFKKALAGKPQISVDARNFNTQETEQSKAYGKTLGDIRSSITTAAFAAPETMAKLNRIEQLLKGVDGGGAASTGLQIAQTANALGLKLDPKLGNKEAAEALARELAGGLRQPGTGPMTDKDFENFLTQVPSLSKTAEGRAQIIATSRAKLARDIEIGKLAREYAKKNSGVIDDGFMDVVSDYVAQNPVVQRTSVSDRPNQFPDMSAIEAELARRAKVKGR
ncbi:MAG: hypothetical protein ACM34A_12185 [Bacillota bacterium]